LGVTVSAQPTTSDLDAKAVDWLLSSDEPGIRLQARRDLLGEPAADDEARVLDGPRMRSLLDMKAGADGKPHAYGKWAGAHWRLVSAVELGCPAGEPRAVAAYEQVLHWLTRDGRLRDAPQLEGLYRHCGSQEGNALTVGVRLGLADDERVRLMVVGLLKWQWPDGGWNCDKEREAKHSSFNETVTPMGGLGLYSSATGNRDAAAAGKRAAELLLSHQVYRSHTTGEIGNEKWLELRYPPYWRYDVLQGLVMLSRVGALPDPRAADAAAWLRSQQQPDGRWRLIGSPMWKTGTGMYRDPAGWERSGASQMLTLNALRVLRAQNA
jgi:hypothetical protein